MKVESPGSVSGIGGPPKGPGTPREQEQEEDEKERRDEHAVEDQLELFGVPQAELTPKVQAALTTLLGEIEGLRQELEAVRRRTTELERLADHDFLTPLFNRRAFLRELTRLVAYTTRYSAPLSVIYVDVDDLKSINDRFGHKAGDAALVGIARALLGGTRSSDIVGRLGGDEFGVILPHAAASEAQETADRLAAAVSEISFAPEGVPVPLSITCGTHMVRPGEEAETVLAEADARMYEGKSRASERWR